MSIIYIKKIYNEKIRNLGYMYIYIHHIGQIYQIYRIYHLQRYLLYIYTYIHTLKKNKYTIWTKGIKNTLNIKKNKLKCYPQQLEVSSLFSPAQPEVRMYLPEPDLRICLPEPHLGSAPEPSGTLPNHCTGTFRNLTSASAPEPSAISPRYLHKNPPELHPTPASAPEPSGTSPRYLRTLRNLTEPLYPNLPDPDLGMRTGTMQNLT